MFHNGTEETFVPLRLHCDPAVVKFDEHAKLCLTIQRLIYKYNLLVIAGRKKECIEAGLTALARQRETTYGEKVKGNTDPEFSS